MLGEFEKALEQRVESLVDKRIEELDLATKSNVEEEIVARIEEAEDESLKKIRRTVRETITQVIASEIKRHLIFLAEKLDSMPLGPRISKIFKELKEE